MKVALISGPRSPQAMGLESAELRLLDALRANPDELRANPDELRLELRVVGGRAARRHARSAGGRWYPAPAGRLPRRARRSADLLHLLGLDVPPPPDGRFVAMVHDLAALRFPDEGSLPPWAPQVIARAARVLTPSRFTAGELQELFGVAPDRIRVVPNGPGQPVSSETEPLSEQELRALGLSTPFVLRMGGYTKRKNVPVLLDAWPEVRRRTGASLALAGPAQAARDVQLAAAASLDGVVVLDYLPAALVPRLLRSASALVSTSTYEGFGLPPLEAMAARTPVVAVRSAAVEEVCGEAALLVESEAGALTDGLVRVLEDQPLRSRLIETGLRRATAFGWQEAAVTLREVYRELQPAPLQRGRPAGDRERPAVACRRHSVAISPRWARLYLGYERSIPNHPGKRSLLRLLLRAVNLARPQPFAWRMGNGALLAISPLEGLAFAWTVGWTCFQTGCWEPHVERCIRSLLRPGDTAVDVGANLGYFTTVMAQRVGGGGRVWSFEPVPPTFERLQLSVSLNDLHQVTALPLALGDADATAQIAFDARFAGSASFHAQPQIRESESHHVPVRRLDDLVQAGIIALPRLIKIDVEGHELAVVRGALQTLRRARPSVIFEFSQSLARRGGWTLPELAEAIASCADYRFFEIGDDALRPIGDLATYAPRSGRYGADLLATCDPLVAEALDGATVQTAREPLSG